MLYICSHFFFSSQNLISQFFLNWGSGNESTWTEVWLPSFLPLIQSESCYALRLDAVFWITLWFLSYSSSSTLCLSICSSDLLLSQSVILRLITESFKGAHMVELLQSGFDNSLLMPEVEFHTALWYFKLPIQELLQKDLSIWPLLMRHSLFCTPSPISRMDLPMQK